ncbi:gamma carbonic anhydrase family protein [Algicola sagamiensis]|uniref:gamma carbonic anhydrase family protein n=1 Tax=Algicola sagamiensis TaxID=163869 RepID=UPI00038291BE|nr:gamma carbonic anhydrase family protein [Algicola sagamiensis]
MKERLRKYRNILPTVKKNVYIDPDATVIGEVTLHEDVSIWPLVSVRGDVNRIEIGARSNIQDGTVIHVTRKSQSHPEGFPTIIGEDVTVGHKVMLHGCQLGHRILVGMGAIIMDDVTVEDDVIIGAGALVPPGKTLEKGYLYIGSPAKKARPLTKDELSFLKVSSDNYVRLKDEYLDGED